MTKTADTPKSHPEELRMRWDPVFDALRGSVRHVGTVLGGLGAFLVAGIVIATSATVMFGELAERVMQGNTQAFDNAVLTWMGAHRSPLVDAAMVEVTALGTGVVVLTVVGIAALFLSLTRHRYSAFLLLVATGGGLLLNTVLKLFFDRPRPQVFEWGTHAVSSSFPSGHAMSATIVYSTVAYLASRLYRRNWPRWVTMFIALFMIAMICASRMYLGVHYPSDVLAGAMIGLGWAAFCMATLEAIQRVSQRSAPEIQKDEEPAPEPARS